MHTQYTQQNLIVSKRSTAVGQESSTENRGCFLIQIKTDKNYRARLNHF